MTEVFELLVMELTSLHPQRRHQRSSCAYRLPVGKATRTADREVVDTFLSVNIGGPPQKSARTHVKRKRTSSSA